MIRTPSPNFLPKTADLECGLRHRIRIYKNADNKETWWYGGLGSGWYCNKGFQDRDPHMFETMRAKKFAAAFLRLSWCVHACIRQSMLRPPSSALDRSS